VTDLDTSCAPGRIDGRPTPGRVGKIKAFHGEVPGPITVSLQFRVGWANEALPSLGMSHVIEHVALSSLQGSDLAYNGEVQPLRTIFWCRGDVTEVTGFLATVTAALRDLPTSRLDDHRNSTRNGPVRDVPPWRAGQTAAAAWRAW
jgi:hypothetical protein